MEKEIYQTSDINIAATLLSLGVDILGINPADPSRVLFYFDESNGRVANFVNSYWQGDLRVDPKSLINCRRDLLSRVKESERNLKGY